MFNGSGTLPPPPPKKVTKQARRVQRELQKGWQPTRLYYARPTCIDLTHAGRLEGSWEAAARVEEGVWPCCFKALLSGKAEQSFSVACNSVKPRSLCDG